MLHQRYVNRFTNNRHETHKLVDLCAYYNFESYTLKTRQCIPFGKVIKIDAITFDYQDMHWDLAFIK